MANPSDAMSTPTALRQAMAHHQAGRLREAEHAYRQILQAQPRQPDALHLLGVLALQVGQPQAARELIEQALAVQPSDNRWCDLGNALGALGRRDDAIGAYRQALAMNADLAEALCNLGQRLLERGEVDDAVACGRRAVVLKPGFVEAHCNLGNALRAQGRGDEAIASYRAALQLRPDLAVVHGNLADALHALGRDDEAIDACRRALALTPGSAALHLKLGRWQRRQGRWADAIDSHLHALQLQDDAVTRHEFVQTVRGVHLQAPHDALRGQLIRALDEGWADPAELLTPAVSLIECHPAVREAIARVGLVDSAAGAAALDASIVAAMAADDLLQRLLMVDIVNSLPLERLLTALRRRMLDDALSDAEPATERDGATLRLACALARQCFFNEYVYACSDDERRRLAVLHARLAEAAAQGRVPPMHALAASAAYAPLSDLPAADDWAARAWPPALAALFVQQVLEPRTEQRWRAEMPRLTTIDDAVSREVQAQYEANPYPRWTWTPPSVEPGALDILLRRRFPHAPFDVASTAHRRRPLEVLIAGCGTGQHPISVARQLADAQVLGVDLSLASLAYAKRRSDELGLSRIDYAQADILQLAAIGRRFDLIESSGVLHHLADPMAGWRVLAGLLRPGGFMAIGLYSEAGRQDVVAARRRIAEQGLQAHADDIRLCRQQMMSDALAPQFAQLLASRDFHATSACRDLLFHVQEHRFTVPELKAAIAALGLRFIGFVLDADAEAAYDRRFPDDPARIDLDHWQAFETGRPRTFARMYQFWLQKPLDAETPR